MTQAKIRSLNDFYESIASSTQRPITAALPSGINQDIGHFNVFSIAEARELVKQHHVMPYSRRAYYKISFIQGKHRVEFADKVIDIDTNTLLFATPRLPYHWVPQEDISGAFCIFTDAFLVKAKSGVVLDELPIFRPGGYPVFEISDGDADEAKHIFDKMLREITSDYEYKYDLLRNYLLELIHVGQKLRPNTVLYSHQTVPARISSLFLELLERQFPIDSPDQKLELRSASDYAERLSLHVNSLNKALKDNIGKTTTELIGSRIVVEAKLLLKQTDWSISQIAWSLGFEEVAHFFQLFQEAGGSLAVVIPLRAP